MTLNNQLSVQYFNLDVLNKSTVNIILRNLRITFLPPELKKVVRFHVDLQHDLKEVPLKIKEDMHRIFGSLEVQTQINHSLITEEDHNDQGVLNPHNKKPLVLQNIDS